MFGLISFKAEGSPSAGISEGFFLNRRVVLVG